MPNTSRNTVLIVDDEPRNLSLLEAVLAPLGIRTVRATNGLEAVAAFKEASFDLVLLDVMMPVLDGLAALAQMREHTPAAERIPIVLVTALAAREDRLRGLEAGADDFLSKPLDPQEVRCRVRTFLALRETQRLLRARADELERVQRARAELSRLVVHDLKNPLAALQGNLQWVRQRASKLADPAMIEALDDSASSSARLLTLVGTLAEVERAEQGHLTLDPRPTVAVDLLESIARRHRRDADLRGITIAVRGDSALTPAFDSAVMERVLENLMENASRFAGNRGAIELAVEPAKNGVTISVANTGRPIAEPVRAHLFDKYATTETQGHHQGLGLYFCRLAAEAHQGTISVESDPTWPTRFSIFIPEQRPAAKTSAMRPSAFLD